METCNHIPLKQFQAMQYGSISNKRNKTQEIEIEENKTSQKLSKLNQAEQSDKNYKTIECYEK